MRKIFPACCALSWLHRSQNATIAKDKDEQFFSSCDFPSSSFGSFPLDGGRLG